MQNLLKILIFLTPIFSSVYAVNDEYTIGIGDELRILVYGEPDLTVNALIEDDGNMNFPFLGEIKVIDKTANQIQKIIHARLLGDYLIQPSVDVSIISYRPFFIHGEVKKPGAYAYQPGLNIDQAIALSGGLTERASEQKIYIKKDVNGETVTRKVNVTYNISPGDSITIKQSFF